MIKFLILQGVFSASSFPAASFHAKLTQNIEMLSYVYTGC